MDLDLTLAQRIILDTPAKFIKREMGPIPLDLDRSMTMKKGSIHGRSLCHGSDGQGLL
jgi:hypothetical protein